MLVFGWFAYQGFQQTLISNGPHRAAGSAQRDFDVPTLSNFSSADSDRTRIRSIALRDNEVLMHQVREWHERMMQSQEQTDALVNQWADQPDVQTRYDDYRRRIKAHLQWVLDQDPEHKIPRDYLRSLDEQFADGPL